MSEWKADLSGFRRHAARHTKNNNDQPMKMSTEGKVFLSLDGSRWSHIERVCLWTRASLIWDVDDTHQQQCEMRPSSLLPRNSLTQTRVNGVWSLLIHLCAAFCKYTSSINHHGHLILVSKLCVLIVNDSVKPEGEFTLTQFCCDRSVLFSKRVADSEKSCPFYFMQMSLKSRYYTPFH